MKDLVIYGEGLIAELARFYFDRHADYRVVAFTNTAEFMKADSAHGLPVLRFESIQDRFPPGDCEMFVALGYAKRNSIRAQRYFEAKAKGYTLASYISPRATYYGTPLGDNCFVFEDNTIQPFTRIGNNVTLWSGNHIGHHSSIGDHCFVSSHVVVSGCCTIGDASFLGVNATLRDNVKVGERSVIGAGALVLADIPAGSVVIPDPSTQQVITKA